MRWGTLIIAAILPLNLMADVWRELAPLPDERGFAGAYAGVSGDALIVAGGTHFPNKMPWEGGVKSWFDDVYVLEKPDGSWRKVGMLPRASGYGVSISLDQGLLLIGGGNATEHFQDVLLLKWTHGTLITTALPKLPKPCAFMTGTAVGTVIHVCGGIEKPDSTTAMASLWTLDLKEIELGWKTQTAHPGGGRILAAGGGADGGFFVFSGAALKAGADGKPIRNWLKDAWKFSATDGWQQLADLPRVSVAAPSPMPVIDGRLLVLGGDDGALVDFQPKERHPGFPRSVLVYDTGRNAWSVTGEVPFSLVTTPVVIWQGRIVIPGGEARPGVRSSKVWMLD